MLTPAQKSALQQIAAASVVAEKKTGCPAELSAAQAILESGLLQRAPGNNCFGIKANSRAAGQQYVFTHEVEFPNDINSADRQACTHRAAYARRGSGRPGGAGEWS